MKDFRTLIVWQKSHSLAVLVYKLTHEFPKEEIKGIASQLRRAIISTPTNIAEGFGRGSDKDFARFIQIALGSANEAEYLILFSSELGYLNNDLTKQLTYYVCEVKKMLISLLINLNKHADS
jgi:four helix bundle protein